MTHPSFATLHVGYGPELTLLSYLYWVLLHLLAFGVIAVLLARGAGVVGAVRAKAFPGKE